MLPSNNEDCKHLAYVLTISSIYARHIGLINKTGQSDWEISYPVQQYLDFMKMYFFEHFTPFISSTFAQSAERQFKGYIARAIAGCLMSTVVNNIQSFEADIKYANFQTLLCMESSALTLYWANMALLNGITHLVDSNIVIVNQLIRWKLNVPILELDFFCSVLDPDIQLDENSDDFKRLRDFLHRIRNAKTRAEGREPDMIKDFTGSYVQVGLYHVGYSNHCQTKWSTR